MDYTKMLKKDLIILLNKRDKEIKKMIKEKGSISNPLLILNEKRKERLEGQFKIVDKYFKKNKSFKLKDLLNELNISKQAYYKNEKLKQYIIKKKFDFEKKI